ncbi:excinuclease ABC subunit UvrA [uncultured Acetobacteroides sp.]|uniref:excinuclease ABC subunit UvrA n=1 Tax=uncultured Acetobacteroides sp. TaxID=1760811 RepID=UPI0029F5B394|nr:excinuclease ABC subunit UvrA [uncultured Acetobacteroides sp.]
MGEEECITVLGARVHNLRDIDVTIPRNALTVITGLSGSGKSSLAFETIYAEGQRRYLETLSAYARQFMGNMERPDVDKITGLSPVIAIEQKTTNKNPRSTVGTITEVYDFMRLLFARASIAYSKNTGEQMVRYTDDQIVDLIIERMEGKKAAVLAPLVKGRKGHYKELFEQLVKKGFLYARVDGNILEIKSGMKLDRYKVHHVELVIDKLVVKADDRKRLRDSVVTAMSQGKGTIMVLDYESEDARFYSRHLMCPSTGISYNEPAPHSFSFNSPQGACPHCNGLGHVVELDVEKIIPNPKLSIRKGGIEPIGAFKNSLIFWQLEAIGRKYGFTLNDPIEDIPEDAMNIILYGSDETFRLAETPMGTTGYVMSFDGVVAYISRDDDDSEKAKKKIEQFTRYITCPDCKGTRLKEEALFFRFADKNISELSDMDIESLYHWFLQVDDNLNSKQKAIARDILKEIRERLHFLLDVGLSYLSLSRSSGTLSGGESQRIRLATQIGSKLVNVLYILDEPSIGLHQRDNMKLITSLKQLRDTGNSVIVVEHDEDMMKEADYIVDMGPRAGAHGGEVVAVGPFDTIKNANSLTGKYLRGELKIPVPEKRREGNGKFIAIKGATGNNLKDVSVKLPLGTFICVTGVSGSGKSTLINGTLHPILSKHFYRSLKDPMSYAAIEGIEHIDKVIDVDQSPIGRTPRSNPATYTNVLGDIRKLFESTPESKIRGFKAGRFSFNVKGGRCEECKGAGVQTIEMNFLPDVYVTCKTCNGKRYNRETLEVRYKGKSISDVLNMTIDQASVFFEHIPAIYQKVKALQDVGLGYITLGQPSTTLSGGESQRVKLATELAKRDTGNTLYILDEPTTGLHFDDVRQLLEVLQKLVERGNTMIVIEHNLDVIKVADHIIDMGPEGGAGGGLVVATGTPEEVAKKRKSYTGQFLKEYLR